MLNTRVVYCSPADTRMAMIQLRNSIFRQLHLPYIGITRSTYKYMTFPDGREVQYRILSLWLSPFELVDREIYRNILRRQRF